MDFRTLRRGFLLPLALLGSAGLVLAGCGGGGGDGRVPDDPRGPEIPIVPADDHGDTRADATALALGSSVAGSIETGDDEDFFEVEITETGTLTVYTTGSLDTVGELQRSDGSRLAGDDDSGGQANFRIERGVGAGTHYIRVESAGTATGNYVVLARFTPAPAGDDHGNSRSNATSLAIGGSVAGEIEVGSDEDFFRVVVAERGTLTVHTTGGLDTTGELQAGDGSSLEVDDDSGAQRNFRIEHDVAPGTYYVKVGSFRTATGSYVVLAQFTPAPAGDDHGDTRSSATVLRPGGSVTGEIEEGDDEDLFRVDVAQSGTLTLYTTGSLDTLGELLAGDGSFLAADDDSGTRGNFRIVHHAVPGTYYIKVGSYSRRTGAYTVHAELEGDHADTPGNATPIVLGQSFSGRIDSATDVDYFRLPIDTPGRLTIETSGSANPDIAVFDADGVEIPGIPGSWIGDITRAVLDKGREIVVRLSGGNPGQNYSGRTSFSASQQPVNQPPVIENQFATIRLELTVGTEEPTIPGLPAGETLQCGASDGNCRVVTEPSLEKAVVFQHALAFFFSDPEGETLRFRVRCALGDATCGVAEDDGELQILPNLAKTRGVLLPEFRIRPEIGTVTLRFDITAIDPHDQQVEQTLTIEVVVIDDSWEFRDLDPLAIERGTAISDQVDNAIDLLEYVTPRNPEVTFDVSLSGGGTVAGLAWELSSVSADGALSYLSFGATEQTPLGIHEILITATHPDGTTRQQTLSVEVVEADEGENGDLPIEIGGGIVPDEIAACIGTLGTTLQLAYGSPIGSTALCELSCGFLEDDPEQCRCCRTVNSYIEANPGKNVFIDSFGVTCDWDPTNPLAESGYLVNGATFSVPAGTHESRTPDECRAAADGIGNTCRSTLDAQITSEVNQFGQAIAVCRNYLNGWVSDCEAHFDAEQAKCTWP